MVRKHQGYLPGRGVSGSFSGVPMSVLITGAHYDRLPSEPQHHGGALARLTLLGQSLYPPQQTAHRQAPRANHHLSRVADRGHTRADHLSKAGLATQSHPDGLQRDGSEPGLALVAVSVAVKVRRSLGSLRKG